jgi:exonuclease VII large subunit
MTSTHLSENIIASLETILDAIRTSNYELFLTVGDSDYKARISQEMFDSVSSQLAPHMAEGYNIIYFGNIKQGKYQIYLWKLSFADDGDEFIARMTMNRDKVGGIMIT